MATGDSVNKGRNFSNLPNSTNYTIKPTTYSAIVNFNFDITDILNIELSGDIVFQKLSGSQMYISDTCFIYVSGSGKINFTTAGIIFIGDVDAFGDLTNYHNTSGLIILTCINNTTGNEVIRIRFIPNVRNIYYDDEYPSGVWVPAGSNEAPTYENVTINGLDTRLLTFPNGSVNKKISNQFEIIHGAAFYELNEDIVQMDVHAHIMKSNTNSGEVRLQVEMIYIRKDFDSVSLFNGELVYDMTGTSLDRQFIASQLLSRPSTVTFAKGDKILFTIGRDPNLDTYDGSIYLLQCAMHVPRVNHGSPNRF